MQFQITLTQEEIDKALIDVVKAKLNGINLASYDMRLNLHAYRGIRTYAKPVKNAVFTFYVKP